MTRYYFLEIRQVSLNSVWSEFNFTKVYFGQFHEKKITTNNDQIWLPGDQPSDFELCSNWFLIYLWSTFNVMWDKLWLDTANWEKSLNIIQLFDFWPTVQVNWGNIYQVWLKKITIYICYKLWLDTANWEKSLNIIQLFDFWPTVQVNWGNIYQVWLKKNLPFIFVPLLFR